MTTSAIVKINNTPLATSGVTGYNATAGSTVTVTLSNPANVQTWTIFPSNYDGYNSNFLPATVLNSLIRIDTYDFEFTAPNLNVNIGGGNIWTSITNQGLSDQNIFTFGIWVLGANGLRTLIGGEDLESNISVGVAYDLNAAIANVGQGSESAVPSGPAGGDLSGTYPNPSVATSGGHTIITNNTSAGGDLSGTYPNPIISKIDGYVLPNPGSNTGLLQSSGSALSWGNVSLTTQVTGVLPTANQGSQTMLGDVTGTTVASTVVKLQGNAIKPATFGASQDGYVLTWVNADGYVEAKPINVTLSGDVTGTSTASVVSSISGASPINITPSNFNWLKTVSSPELIHAAQTTDTATTSFTINAQNAFTSATTNLVGGSLTLTGGNGSNRTGSGFTPASITISGGKGPTNGAFSSVTLTGGSGISSTGSTGDGGFIIIKGGVNVTVKSVSGNYTAVPGDYLIGCVTTSNTITVTLASSPATGDKYIVSDITGSASTHNITVSGNSHNIGGSSTITLSTNFQSATFIFTGTVWNQF